MRQGPVFVFRYVSHLGRETLPRLVAPVERACVARRGADRGHCVDQVAGYEFAMIEPSMSDPRADNRGIGDCQ